jgi:hypothetical protein
MYANKLAVAVKHRGKVLQEFGEVVYLPFGSEYGLLIKNLNSVRASVKVSIDGVDVTPGINLVVQPNSSIDLERFIKNGNLNAGNRFKFIERNAAVMAHRGARPDDGLIRVTFCFEVPQQVFYQAPVQPSWSPTWQGGVSGTVYDSSYAKGATLSSSTTNGMNNASSAVAGSVLRSRSAQPEAGITAPGSVSTQQFQSVGWFQTGPEQPPIILQLAGQAAETGAVQNIVYSRSKVDCVVCGAIHKPSSKFCSQCGAALVIIG